jgi:nucleoid DNA-binding protein
MVDNHSKKGKSGLIRAVMAKGFSVRQAIKAVNAVFDRMTLAVRRGEVVEIPGGTIQARLRQGKPRQRFQKLFNVQTGESRHKFVRFPGQRRVVRFRPDLALDLTPLPVPPPPPTPEEIECQQLATELLGHPVNARILKYLKQHADFPQPKPGSLLRRLKEVKARGRNPKSFYELGSWIRGFYWI